MQTFVTIGGGGVGKTTSSSALAMALARSGKRTLVVTVDPAQRLADALGIRLGDGVQAVTVDEASEDRLFALMPDPTIATRAFMDILFKDEPASLARLSQNKLFLMLEDKLVGMNELVCMTLALESRHTLKLDALVVDTAPSRYALDFLTYPGRLAKLLDGKSIKWLGALSAKGRGGGVRNWGRRRVEGTLARVIGEQMVSDLGGMFTEIGVIQANFIRITRNIDKALLGGDTQFVTVAAPTRASQEDVAYLLAKLERMEREASLLILNRSDVKTASFAQTIKESRVATPPIMRALRQLSEERTARQKAADRFASATERQHPGLRQERLPLIEASVPVEIVKALAGEIASGGFIS